MKNIIAISACLKRCSIAISYEDNLYEVNENVDAAANLVWLVDNLVKSKNVDLKKIEGIVVASGPGSFTGIRVAQSFAKGLALSLKLPAVSLSYFDVIESICVDENFQDVVIVIKSEKNQIYYKTADKSGISSYESLANEINNGAVLIGDAIEEIIPHLTGKTVRTICNTDFRNARYLLNFSPRITRTSKISPYYMGN
ncbi:MAG: tRNA (adenosine(37)-N6)-threonylcarbamoyltransferase complex dimerization subunit type 1 TsaB [Holosporaceae bacterium]|jgi:tRNA threonylcarbamoyl adenosine modification protein YeaZ|nr:tRNA (adenosine(37)-N6)-threonylcarbamoyltransferase complex dimerization subunit type 1 TsaB [Holosporaceae bacterium]